MTELSPGEFLMVWGTQGFAYRILHERIRFLIVSNGVGYSGVCIQDITREN